MSPLGIPPVPGLLPAQAAPRPSGLVKPDKQRDNRPDNRVGETAQDFEAVLLTQVLKGLRRTIPGAENKPAMDALYHDLFDEQLAVDLTRKGGIGLARIIKAYLEQPGQAPPGTRPPKGPNP